MLCVALLGHIAQTCVSRCPDASVLAAHEAGLSMYAWVARRHLVQFSMICCTSPALASACNLSAGKPQGALAQVVSAIALACRFCSFSSAGPVLSAKATAALYPFASLTACSAAAWCECVCMNQALVNKYHTAPSWQAHGRAFASNTLLGWSCMCGIGCFVTKQNAALLTRLWQHAT